EAAELAGQRRVDLVAYLGAAVVLHQPRARAGGEPPHDSERRSLDLGLDLARRIRPRHLDRDVELEFEVRDLGVQHRGVVVAIDFVQVPHALDAGREEARIAQLGENRRARRLEVDVAGELHGRVTGAARAPGFRSGERYCTRTTSPGGATQRK